MRSFSEDLDASRAFHGTWDLVMLPALLGMAGRQREGPVLPFALRWRA